MWLSWWCKWRPVLAVVQPETFIRRRFQGFRWFCHGTPYSGRPSISVELPARIRQIAHENLMRGQRRIANELRLKLGLRVSLRTVHT
jgi:putative transposase